MQPTKDVTWDQCARIKHHQCYFYWLLGWRRLQQQSHYETVTQNFWLSQNFNGLSLVPKLWHWQSSHPSHSATQDQHLEPRPKILTRFCHDSYLLSGLKIARPTLSDQEWHLNLVPDDTLHVFHLTAILQSSRAFTLAGDSVRTSVRNLQWALTGCHKSKFWGCLSPGEKVRRSAGVGMGVGLSVLLWRGLPGAHSAESLMLQSLLINQPDLFTIWAAHCRAYAPRLERASVDLTGLRLVLAARRCWESRQGFCKAGSLVFVTSVMKPWQMRPFDVGESERNRP